VQIGWGPFASLYSWDKGVNLIAEKYDASERQSGRAENTLSRLTAQLCDLILEQGMDIKTASHMLGHTDAEFTMNTYMHVTDSMQENVANTMGNLIETQARIRRKFYFQHKLNRRIIGG